MITTTVVALAQAKKSSLGERSSLSGEPVLPRRDTNSGKKRKPERTLAQARLVHLDEIVSRLGDSSSPRRDFAQQQRCVSWCFRLGESNSPRQKYQVTNLFPHEADQSSSSTNQLFTKSSRIFPPKSTSVVPLSELEMQVQSMRMVPKLTQQESGFTDFELKMDVKVESNLHGGKGIIVERRGPEPTSGLDSAAEGEKFRFLVERKQRKRRGRKVTRARLGETSRSNRARIFPPKSTSVVPLSELEMQVQSMRMVPKLTQQESGFTDFELKMDVKVESNLHGGKGIIVERRGPEPTSGLDSAAEGEKFRFLVERKQRKRRGRKGWEGTLVRGGWKGAIMVGYSEVERRVWQSGNLTYREGEPGDSSVLHYFGVLERGPPSGTLPAAKRRLGLFQFLGLWMKRLAGLVESPGGAGHFSDFGFFWGSGLNLIGAKVRIRISIIKIWSRRDCTWTGLREVGIHRGGEMVGFWMREESGKYPDSKHRLAARGLAARRSRSSRDTAEAVPPSGRCCENNLKGIVRLAVRDTRQAVWELAAPGGTCPPPGDLYCCSFEF
ncbi:hypothetical protein DEO72_LG6g1238 [Vigna unguiculata]|uniref:Uncharacterized protein n=1 Tax=Vigna unguiculata TaxID=3917 RepID=A0A4D6M6V3_VIGUN|nr:hypothetical protein DEO72_LG6g1238 [Vigna unguiculata]